MKKLSMLLICLLAPALMAADVYKQTLAATTSGIALALNPRSKYVIQPWDGNVCASVTCSSTITVTCLSSGPGKFVPTKGIFDTGKAICNTPYLQVIGETATVQVKVEEIIE